ncbi:MAG: NAD-glutamate dehydrogenase [Campylobacterales bacterium]|nr:NAD-glutamate dehydrogenase [Campylobacterales bacterium]
MPDEKHIQDIYELSNEELIIPQEVEQTLQTQEIVVKINAHEIQPSIYIYANEQLALSKTIPVIHSFNFIVESEISKLITHNEKEYYFSKLNITVTDSKKLQKSQKHITQLISSILNGELNFLCSIFVLSYLENFTMREILLFIALAKYKEQLTSSADYHATIGIFIHYSHITNLLRQYFIEKFDPSLQSRNVEAIEEQILAQLSNVEAISDDNVLRLVLEIFKNTQRTNYFLDNSLISFKIHTNKINYPFNGVVPAIEAFVYHPDFCGVHLRMDKVSRGGLRWSNRKGDYRDEIKALMVAQEAKNAVIVPKGAKGGFVIKEERPSKEEFERYYRMFIVALLRLVDNIVENQIVRNEKIIAYDGEDSYFVVAADKGTSEMSDTANAIAIEQNYWLKDAFASGGSKGYHHKSLGITAKGAIKSSERFFIEKGVDIYKDPISVVGIGSMNGDVFGNGLIESQAFLLIAAISHREIFIDPTPDAAVSYIERKRLFESESGNWSDYDQSKISKGGGVFYRTSKSIQLTPEIKKLIATDKEELNGEELAKALLGLKVDMIYLGGIGTYFKSSHESSSDIGDKENENLRLNADKIQAEVICEGANLGMTLAGRIEFTLRGGKVNLDSIDNAAGVNTSDHEVNIKIFLNTLLTKEFINATQRDEQFKELTSFVVKKVLQSNYHQALALSLDEVRSRDDKRLFKKTIHVIDMSLDYFSRKNFHIPRNVDFDEIVKADGAIVRPTLSLLLLYAKIVVENILKSSTMLESSEFDTYFYQYFPQNLRATYQDTLKTHPLRKEMAAMIISNDIINRCGSTFIADLHDIGSKRFLGKIKAYLINNELFNGDVLRKSLYEKDTQIGIQKMYASLIGLEEYILYSMENTQRNLLEEEFTFGNVYEYRQSIMEILQSMAFKTTIEDAHYSQEELNTTFEYIKLTGYILKIKRQTSLSFRDIAKLTFEIVIKLNLVTLIKQISSIEATNSIELQLKNQVLFIIERIIFNLTKGIIGFRRKHETIAQSIESYFEEKEEFARFNQLHDEFMKREKNSIMESSILVNELLLLT